MSDTDRIIGRLEEFKNATEKRLDRIEVKLDSLSRCKPKTTKHFWKFSGLGALLVAIVAAAKEWCK